MDVVLNFWSKFNKLGFRRVFSDTPKLSLRSNFVWTFLGDSVFVASQWAMLILLAKLASTEVVGIFALGLAITAPIMLLANLKLRAVLVTDAKNEFQFSDYLGLRLVTVVIGLFVITGIALVQENSRETALIIILIGVAKAFDGISDILYGYIQKHERMDRIAISRMLQGIFQLLSLGIVLYFTRNLFLATLAWAIASGTITIFYDIPNVRYVHKTTIANLSGGKAAEKLSPSWNRQILSKLAIVTLPLGLAVMLGSLWVNIPRYFIEDSLGKSELGIFAAVASFMMVGTTILTALGQPVIPKLAKLHAAKEFSMFDRLTLRLVLFGFFVAFLGIFVASLFGKQILTLIYTPDYAEHYDLLILLMIVSGVKYSYVYLGTAIQAMREFKINLPILVVSCLLILILSIIFIPEYGVQGAAWAMLIATLFEAVVFTLAFIWVRILKRSQIIQNA